MAVEISQTEIRHRKIKDVQTSERRYFISTIEANPVLFMETVRAHLSVENSLHYVLDVAFKEDACRIKKGDAPENMSFIRKIALTIARKALETKSSVAGRIKTRKFFIKILDNPIKPE